LLEIGFSDKMEKEKKATQKDTEPAKKKNRITGRRRTLTEENSRREFSRKRYRNRNIKEKEKKI